MPPVVVDPQSSQSTDPCAPVKAQLDAYLAAERAVLNGLSFEWGGRRLTRANLSEILAGRREWEAKYTECLRCQQPGSTRMGGLRTSLAVLNDEGGGGCGCS